MFVFKNLKPTLDQRTLEIMLHPCPISFIALYKRLQWSWQI